VDPEVTGVPIQVFESARLMKTGFLKAALYALIIVLVCIAFHFRDLRSLCLSFVPLLVGLIWTLELMWLLGLSFNLANFFCLPILVGYGVTGGVQVLHRFREFRSTKDVGGTVSSAVSLSFLTTIVGFGAMISASHRGIMSLGLVTSIGCGAILVASLVLLPSILTFFSKHERNP
jgi:predicted RND superfamily exporter protein